MLVEIENQCLEVYRRKLDEASKCRAKMLQEISKIRAEISRIHSALGDNSPHVKKTCFFFNFSFLADCDYEGVFFPPFSYDRLFGRPLVD